MHVWLRCMTICKVKKCLMLMPNPNIHTENY